MGLSLLYQPGTTVDGLVGYRPSVKPAAKGDTYQSYFGWSATEGSNTITWETVSGATMTFSGSITAGSTATVTVNVGLGPGNKLWINPGGGNAEIVTAIAVANYGNPTSYQVTAKFANAHTSGEAVTLAMFQPTDVGKSIGVAGAGATTAGQWLTAGINLPVTLAVNTGAAQNIYQFPTAATNAGAIPLSGTVNTSGTAVTSVSGSNFSLFVANNAITIAGTVYTVASVTNSTHLVLTTSAGTQTGAAFTATVFQPTASFRWIFEAYGGAVTWGIFGSNTGAFTGEQVQVYDSQNPSAFGTGYATLGSIETSFNNKVVFSLIGPTYKYYAIFMSAVTVDCAVFIHFMSHGNMLTTTITGYNNPLSVTVATTASYSVTNAYGYFGTDDTAAIVAATNNLVASYGIGGQSQYSSAELYFPPGQYLVSGPMFCDRIRWVGSHTDTCIRVAPGNLSIPVYNSQGGLWQPLIFLGHALQAAAAQTQSPVLGSEWSGDYPSFGSRLEDITIYMNEMPGVAIYAESTQEHSGVRNVDVNAWTGLFVAPNGTATWNTSLCRAYQQIGSGAMNNGWDDFGGGGGYTNIPHPQVNLTQAITSTGSQTVTVNRTDIFSVGTVIDIGHLTQNLESVVITAIGAGTITANFTKTHPNGDSVLMNWMTACVDFIGNSRVSINNITANNSSWAGYGYGIRCAGSIMTIEDVHAENGLYSIIVTIGSMCNITLLEAQDPTCAIGIYSPVQYRHENVSAPRGILLYYDAFNNIAIPGFFDPWRSTGSTPINLSGYGTGGAVNLMDGQLVSNYLGTFIQRLYFGVNYAPSPQPSYIPLAMYLGNAVQPSQFAFAHYGTGAAPNNFLAFLATLNSWGSQTIPLQIDAYFNAIMTPFIEFADGTITIAGSVVLPRLKFGHNVGSDWFSWEHVGSPGNVLALQGSSNAGGSWQTIFTANINTLSVGVADIFSTQLTAPGSLLMSKAIGGLNFVREALPLDIYDAMYVGGTPTPNQPIVWTGSSFSTIAAAAAPIYPTAGVVPEWTGTAWSSFTSTGLLAILANASVAPSANLPLMVNSSGNLAIASLAAMYSSLGVASGAVLAQMLSGVPTHSSDPGYEGQIAIKPSDGTFYWYSAFSSPPQWFAFGPSGFLSSF